MIFSLRTIVLVLGLVFGLGLEAGSVRAQNAPAGPVYLPATTNVVTPASAPVPTVTPASPAPVASSSPTGAEDIHDIRGPITIPYQWLWAAYIVAGLAVLAALYGLWRFIRRKAAAKPKLPYEVALERLEAARALMTPDTVRDYAFTASEIIRVYLEQRFGEKAAHRTTDEFLSDLLLQTGTPLAGHQDRLKDFLSHCDLSKFARWQFSVREMETLHESARDFVLETKPQPEQANVPAHRNASAQPELLQAK